MSSEMVLYILSAARKPVSTISLTYDCEARVNELCAMIEVLFQDGHEAIGAGHTIFGALRHLMVNTRADSLYWQKWNELDLAASFQRGESRFFTRVLVLLFRVVFFRFVHWGDFMRAGFMEANEFEHLLAARMPPNRLACEVSACTGLRISDVLNLRTTKLSERFSVRELKTGKIKRVRLPRSLLDRLLAQAGRIYVFENRLDYRKPRTRQAVYKDLRRAAKLFRVKDIHVSPHSARKLYAVSEYRRTGSIERVKELLNHEDEAVTMLYAMADQLELRRRKK